MKYMLQSTSKQFLIACFCFLVGVSIASFLHESLSWQQLYWLILCLLPILIIVWNKQLVRLMVVCAIIVVIGVGRYQLAFQHVDIPAGVQKIEGTIDAEPDVRQNGVKYIVDTVEYGRVYVSYDLYPRFSYGDVVLLSCKLKRPEPIETFRYDMFLARYRVFVTCQQPRMTVVDTGSGNILLRHIFSLKTSIATQVNLLWHEPYAGFMAGLLYGYRGGLGSLNELFAITGVTHIIAISGYNITLIATILMNICVAMYIPRKKAFWILSIGIALFVIFAGASASVVRAGIMGVIVLFATQLGRSSQVHGVLILTAVIMTLHNPFVLIWDAGFQLSFVATLGLVYLAPKIEPQWQFLPEAAGLRESLVATVAATLSTLPLILFQFGRLSLVAVAVNMLVLWILPYAMAVGFFSVIISYLFMPVARLLGWLAFLMMGYVVLIVKWFALLPWAAVDIRFPWWGMILGYAILIYVMFKKPYEKMDRNA